MLDPEIARRILELALPEATQYRMHALLEKAKAGVLTPAERREAESYEQFGNSLSILKARARAYLNDNPAPPQ